MFKKIKRFELYGRICAVVATEQLERMDIFSSQNTESVKCQIFRHNFFQKIIIYWQKIKGKNYDQKDKTHNNTKFQVSNFTNKNTRHSDINEKFKSKKITIKTRSLNSDFRLHFEIFGSSAPI